QFLHPDWDMFQSGHPVGAFHAAGRAVSGSPIYVSDKPDAHDFNLLKKLVLPDGRVMRPIGIGTPTADCLFHDPTQEAILLKIENQNVVGKVIGIFNAHHEGDIIIDAIHPAHWYEDVMVYAHNSGTFTRYRKADERLEIALPPLGYEILTIIPITNGIAPIGLVEMFNSAGAITLQGIYGDTHRWRVRGQGKFVIYAENKPKTITYNAQNLDYTYDETSKLVTFHLAGDGVLELTVS
ncbi:MAG: hypothetical protein KJ043_11240, partial [Anaerolineae bacterium]|nr:hypothetical protein [Anaerolineae bacterium]